MSQKIPIRNRLHTNLSGRDKNQVRRALLSYVSDLNDA